jgi:hypothetical protein
LEAIDTLKLIYVRSVFFHFPFFTFLIVVMIVPTYMFGYFILGFFINSSFNCYSISLELSPAELSEGSVLNPVKPVGVDEVETTLSWYPVPLVNFRGFGFVYFMMNSLEVTFLEILHRQSSNSFLLFG